MKTDERLEEDSEAPPPVDLMHRLGHAVTERELRLLDRTIGLFQRWRSRLAPPEKEDEHRHARHPAAPAAPLQPTATLARRHRWRGFLIIVALMLATGFAGMTFSYSLLGRAMEAQGLIIDDLRDQVAQMEKADARNVAAQARDQWQIAEQKKAIRGYEAQAQDYESQVAALRQQLVALTPPPPRPPAVASAAPRPQAGQRAAAQQKTGNCVASGSKAAADLARCVENFNRP